MEQRGRGREENRTNFLFSREVPKVAANEKVTSEREKVRKREWLGFYRIL